MDSVAEARFLYVSDLADGVPLHAIADIARRSRLRNDARNVTGLLVFDGSSFAQLVDGPTEAVAELLSRLQRDARHHRIEVLSQGPTAGSRQFPSWRMGYLVLEVEGGLTQLRGLREDAAIAAFLNMLPALDLGVGDA